MTPAEYWAIDVYAVAARDFSDALDLINEISEQTFASPKGAIDPVDALRCLDNMCTAHGSAKTDRELNELLAGPTKRKLRELAPELEDFVGLREIKSFWSGGIVQIDGVHYHFYAGSTWVATPGSANDPDGDARRHGRSLKLSWLRTIRKIGKEELHTTDLVAVIKPVDLVVELRLFQRGPTKILYAIDEATNRVIFEAGTLADPTIKIKDKAFTEHLSYRWHFDAVNGIDASAWLSAWLPEAVDDAQASG